jgi:3-hydroxyisobutyrate dehydrogenase
MTTVAILGTGKMGGAMARRLASSGFDVTLWNRTPAKAEELHIGRVAATPAEATRDADVVISSLTNDAAVRDVYLGEDGVLASAAGKLLIDASTAGPQIAEELGRESDARGARLLQAPVVGSVPAVESGTLLILVGGDRADLEQARPVLEQLGEVRYVGERANAQRLKLIANSMLGITTAAAAELLAAGTAVGSLRPGTCRPRTRVPAGSPHTDHVRGPRPPQGSRARAACVRRRRRGHAPDARGAGGVRRRHARLGGPRHLCRRSP